MYHHAPPGYICPFCLLIQGIENSDTQLKQTDIILRTAGATAFMATRNWPKNQCHVLVISNEHYENIYDLPVSLLSEIHSVSKRVALAMKAEYKCEGVFFMQSNEPAGDQQVWHYHLHVIARYANDDFQNAKKVPFPVSLRAEYAQKLKSWMERSEEKANDRTEKLTEQDELFNR